MNCACPNLHGPLKLIALTGGPGAGKTAVLEVVRKRFCSHLAVLPESASILFGGGFPRRPSVPARRAAQRAIYRVQRELERMVLEEQDAAVMLCDRGTLDGLAYWDGPVEEFFAGVGSTREAELARYAAVIHLTTPGANDYNHVNPMRVESAEEAARIDARVLTAWEGHPRRSIVSSEPDFLVKLARALELLRREVPACCRPHDARSLGAEPGL